MMVLNKHLVLKIKLQSRPKHARLILSWRCMNHSYQMVLCHLLVAMPSLTLLKSFKRASPSLILADTPPISGKISSGTSVLIQGVECGFVDVPLHNIYLTVDLITGPTAVGIRPSLPFQGVNSLFVRQ